MGWLGRRGHGGPRGGYWYVYLGAIERCLALGHESQTAMLHVLLQKPEPDEFVGQAPPLGRGVLQARAILGQPIVPPAERLGAA